jgi:hypothetical protein
VESKARRVFSINAPAVAMTSLTALKIGVRVLRGPANRRRQWVRAPLDETPSTTNPHATFHRRSDITDSAPRHIRQAVQCGFAITVLGVLRAHPSPDLLG